MPDRVEVLTVDAADLHLDYSKNRLTPETVSLLVAVAERAGLRERIDAMWAGEHINVTEDRAVLHVALRAQASEVITADGHRAHDRQATPLGVRVTSGRPGRRFRPLFP